MYRRKFVALAILSYLQNESTHWDHILKLQDCINISNTESGRFLHRPHVNVEKLSLNSNRLVVCLCEFSFGSG